MIEVGVHAGTDITGFGLLGHAVEMALASDVTIRLEAANAPWIEGLAPYVTPENTCGGLKANRAYAEGHVAVQGGTEEQLGVLADPQTSGGLLMAVDAGKLDDLLAALERHGVATRAVVGEAVARTERAVEVV